MYVIIAGLSDIGRNLANLLAKEGNEVVIVERDPAKCAALAESSDLMVIEGDASQKATLEQAGVRQAHALVAAAGDDSQNLLICMMAKEMGVKRVISLVDEPGHAETFKQAGITLQVNPDMVAARHIYRMISLPYVKDFLSFVGTEIFEIEIEEGMKCVGQTISKLAPPNGVKILVVQRGGKYLSADKELQPGDWLTLLVNREAAKHGADFMNRWFAKG